MVHIQLIGIVEPKSEDGKIWRFPYAFPIIIRQLQKTKHTFDLIDTHLHKKTRSELIDFLKRCDAKIYGISSYSEGYLLVKQIAQTIRDMHKDSVIIVGGLLARSDQVLMHSTEVDIAVTGAEGELILPEILDALESGSSALGEVRGITFKDRANNRIVVTGMRPIMTREEYNQLEMPAYEYFDEQLHELAHNINQREDTVKGFPLLTSRGCPFKCTFCGHMYGHKFLRKSWDCFFDEVQFLIERYGVQGFFSFDTNLFLNEKDVNDYCSMYAQRQCSFKIVVEMRATFGDYAMFKKLSEHGVPVITIGFESGCQEMLDRMKKGTHVEKVRRIVEDAVSADLMVYGNFIFGTPGESTRTIDLTRQFISNLEKIYINQQYSMAKRSMVSTSGYNWSILIPSPTSPLYSLAIQEGLIKDEEKYLISLDQEDYSGRFIRAHLRHIGGDVNLSEFPSKQALLYYVNYTMSLIQIRALLYKREILLESTLKKAFEVLGYYLKYILSVFKAKISFEGLPKGVSLVEPGTGRL